MIVVFANNAWKKDSQNCIDENVYDLFKTDKVKNYLHYNFLMYNKDDIPFVSKY